MCGDTTIVHQIMIKNIQYRGKWDRKDNTQWTAESGSYDGHDEDIERREAERAAHDERHHDISFELLKDDIEY